MNRFEAKVSVSPPTPSSRDTDNPVRKVLLTLKQSFMNAVVNFIFHTHILLSAYLLQTFQDLANCIHHSSCYNNLSAGSFIDFC